MILGQETLGFRRAGFSPALSLLMSAFSLPDAPQTLTDLLHCNWNAPLPLRTKCEVCGFGDVLSPVIFTARDNLTSELLRFLSRVAASKPTSWLSMFPHILDHSARTSGPQPAVWALSLSTTKLISRSLTAMRCSSRFGFWLGLVTGEGP